jgi:hypothetical protein
MYEGSLSKVSRHAGMNSVEDSVFLPILARLFVLRNTDRRNKSLTHSDLSDKLSPC